MADRDVRDQVIAEWERILDRAGARHPNVVALELKNVLTAHGIRLVEHAHRDDPVADWRETVQPSTPGDGYRAAREALRQQTGD